MFTGFYFCARLRACFFSFFLLSRWVVERYRYLYMRRSLFERKRRVVTFVFFSGVYLLILQSFVTLGSHFLRLNKPETALEKPLACTQGTSTCIRHCKNQMETRTS